MVVLGGFLVITVSHPTLSCVVVEGGVGLLQLGLVCDNSYHSFNTIFDNSSNPETVLGKQIRPFYPKQKLSD